MCIVAQSTEFWLYFILVAAGGLRYEINQGTAIIGMDGAGTLDPTGGAGLQLMPKTVHKGIKKLF